MFQGDDKPRHPLAWTRFDYLNVSVPSADGTGLASARLPALPVRLRPPNSAPGPGERDHQADGQLGTGANTSAVPMWLIDQLGIQIDKKTRRKIYGISGPLWAYSTELGMEIQCDGPWLDIGVSEVLVPDTMWSRDPDVPHPLLLGLNGFFDRVNMCIDHSKKEFRLELPVG